MRKWSSDRFGDFPITCGAVGHLILGYTDEKKKVIRFGFVLVDDSQRGKV